MNIKRFYFIFVICLAFTLIGGLMFTLSATASTINRELAAPDDRIPIHWFVGLGTGTDRSQTDAQQQVVDDFNASQTAISLTIEFVDPSISVQTLQYYIVTGNPPDIVGPVGIAGSNSLRVNGWILLP